MFTFTTVPALRAIQAFGAIIAMAALALAAPARAAEIHVPGDFPAIQQAIEAAEDGDEIIIAPGTYNELLDLLGKTITLRGEAGAEKTIITGQGLGGSVITCASGEGEGTAIVGLTITRGTGGAAIRLLNSSLRVEACRLTQNEDQIHVQGSQITIVDTVFDNSNGRALRSNAGTVHLVGSIVRGHSSAAVVELTGGGSHEILSCTFEQNVGRVIQFLNTSGTVSDCRFVRNAAPTSNIVGVFNSSVDLSDCDFLANRTDPGTAATFGTGSIGYLNGSGVVRHCRFRNNTGELNSAVLLQYAAVMIDGCEFAANHSTFHESAAIYGYNSSLIIRNSAFCQNLPANIAMSDYTDDGGNVFETYCCGLVGPETIHVPLEASLEDAFSVMVCGEILLAPGVHEGGFELGHNPIAIRGVEGAEATIIDATSLNRSVVTVTGPFSGDVVLEGLTLTGGNALEGGGLHLDAATLPTLIDCRITGNSATRGGGIFVKGGSNLVIDALTIAGNTATAGTGGGGIHLSFGTSASVTNTLFADNTALGGGAVVHAPGSDAVYVNCEFINNTAGDSGGAMLLGGAAVIEACTFAGNVAAQGGAIRALDFADTLIADSLFCDNDPDHVDGPWTDGGGNAFHDACPSPADLNGDGVVDVQDLLILLGSWGPCPPPDKADCPADLDNSGAVDVQDLLILLASWG